MLDELFALADACAALVGAPITIEDTQSRVLAYSSTQDVADPARVSTIVGRRVPDEVIASLRGRGVFRRLARSDEPFFVTAGRGLRARLVVPVRAGTEWLGSIWAVVDDEPADDVLRSLRQTASVVALHLLRMRSQADLARRVLSDRLRAVLSGDVVEAEGWLPPPPWRVVVLAGDDGQARAARHSGSGPAARARGLHRGRRSRARARRLGVGRPPPVLAPAPARRSSTASPSRSCATCPATARPARGSGCSPSSRRSPARPRPPRRAPAARSAGPVELDRSRREATEVQRLRDAGRITGTTTTVEDAWAAVTNARALGGIWTEELLGPVGALREPTTRPTRRPTSRRSPRGSTTRATRARPPGGCTCTPTRCATG